MSNHLELFISKNHPYFLSSLSHTRFSDLFFSDKVVPLSRAHQDSIEQTISAIEKLKNTASLQQDAFDRVGFKPKYESVFMGYDFYITEDGPKLIEINTNAAGGVMVALLNAIKLTRDFNKTTALFRSMFEDALLKAGFDRTPQHVVICDEDPENQKTYFDILLNQSLMNSWGWTVSIEDVKTLQWDEKTNQLKTQNGTPIDLVYNRYCDFYLESEEGQALKKAVLNRAVCCTPHPFSYALLANKARLTQFSSPERWEEAGLSDLEIAAIKTTIPAPRLVQETDTNWLWENRKQFFFKPTQSYGSKAAYKGASMSRKVFDYITQNDYLAQPYFNSDVIDGFKYDIRAYVFDGKIQQFGARLFQGQTMNFQTPNGGFTAVDCQ